MKSFLESVKVLRGQPGGVMATLFVSGLGFGSLQLALPLYLASVHAPPNSIGIVLAMFGVGMIVFEFGWGWLADRFGVPIPLIVSRFLLAASLAGFIINRSLVALALFYLLSAGFMVAGGPLGRAFLGVYLPKEQRGVAIGFHAASMTLGTAFGALAAGYIADRWGLDRVFLIECLLPLVAGFICLYTFRGHYRELLTSVGSAADAASATREGNFRYVAAMVVISTVILLMFFGFSGERSFLPILVEVKLNLPAVYAGTTISVLGIATGFLMVPFGRLSDRWGRKPTIVVGLLLCGVGLIGYGLSGNFGWLLVAVALRAVGTAMAWPAATALLADTTPRARQGLVMAIYGEFENVGAMLGPIVIGYAWAALGISAAFMVVSIFVFAGAAVGMVLIQETRWRGAALEGVAA
jgi:MFS transporter, ACDE family, multidrug resistance protein